MITNLIDGIFSALNAWVEFIMAWFYAAAELAIAPIFSAMLGGYDIWGPLSEFYDIMDMWLDVDLILLSVIAFGNFWMLWITYRVIKSWIPTVSGG